MPEPFSGQPECQGCASEEAQEEEPTAPALHGPEGLATGAGAAEPTPGARTLPSAYAARGPARRRSHQRCETASAGGIWRCWVPRKASPQGLCRPLAQQVRGHRLRDGGHGTPRAGERAGPLLRGELPRRGPLRQVRPA